MRIKSLCLVLVVLQVLRMLFWILPRKSLRATRSFGLFDLGELKEGEKEYMNGKVRSMVVGSKEKADRSGGEFVDRKIE